MLKFVLSAIILLATPATAAAELKSPDHCLEKHGVAVGLPTSTDILFTGQPVTLDGWTVEHSYITIRIDSLTLQYNESNVEYLGALMDWIDTAITQEKRYGYQSLAVLDRDQGVVWLLSQSAYEDNLSCFGHRLPLSAQPSS